MAKQTLRRSVSSGIYDRAAKTYTVPATDGPKGTVEIPAQAVYGIDPNHDPVDGYLAVRSVPGGTATWTRDAALNDSDKSFTVPAGKQWKMSSIQVQLLTTATVGNRVLKCTITNGTNPIAVSDLSAAIAASGSGAMTYSFGSYIDPAVAAHGRLDGSGAASVALANHNFPEMILRAGSVIQIADASGVDAAADDLTVVLHYREIDE